MRFGKGPLIWGFAFSYIVYSFIGDIPALSNYAAFSINVSSLFFIILYLVHSYTNLGAKVATKYLVIATVLGYAFEYLFINTGLLGKYSYSSALAPFLGPIPIFIVLQWAALSYFCLLVADNYLVSAVLMVLLDMSFDPKFSLSLWHWSSPGQYFGVPAANFVGWFVTSATIYGVFYLVTKRKAKSSNRAILFYLLLGISDGALLDLNLGMYTLDVISGILFVVASLLVYLYARRLESRRRRVLGPQPLSKSTGIPPA
jgi:uncharacterized membrane protein